MEVIRKKICIEDFISRVPGNIPVMDIVGEPEVEKKSSWGNIPYKIPFLECREYGVDTPLKKFRYQTLVKIYNSCLDVVKNALYYELDKKGNKWIMSNVEWRDLLDPESNSIIRFKKFVAELPEDALDKELYGLVTEEEVHVFYDEVERIFGTEYSGFNVIKEFSYIIGEVFVPGIYDGKYLDGPHVPYTIYIKQIPDLIDFMTDLKEKAENGCCDLKLYQDYGGDTFLAFLEEFDHSPFENEMETEETTLDIPLLFTSNVMDLGLFRADDAEYVDEDGNPIDGTGYGEKSNGTGMITGVFGESKLMTLRKRKVSIDDNNQELPGIYYKGMSYLETPYQEGYIKNIQVKDGIFCGDTIYELKEEFDAYTGYTGTYSNTYTNWTTSETENVDVLLEYPDIRQRAEIAARDGKIEGYRDGTLESPINDLIASYEKEYGNIQLDPNIVKAAVEVASMNDLKELSNSLYRILRHEYPNCFCMQQPYSFKYHCTYGYNIVNADGELERKEGTFEFVREGTIYVTFRTAINITYVLGGRLKIQGDKITLDEASPYEFDEEHYNLWDGMGIWYNETYPFSKISIGTYVMDGEVLELAYDYIDIESKMYTYEFKGIDFPRKNYILSTDIRYSPACHDDVTDYPIFRDEKMLGVSMDMRGEYDVVIDRGSAGAFERHLKLSEVKTFSDLENYGNNYFNM